MASDWEDTSLIAAPFKCTCMREFRQESAYTKHQRSCTKGKKRLFSALSKAKNLLGSVKRPQVDHSHGTQHASTNTVASSVHPSADLINGRLDSSLSGILLNETPHAGSLSQGNVAASASNAGLDSAPIGTDEDQDLPLAQRRSRRVDVPMPLRFRQYEDVLPQPPPSVTPGHTNSAPGFSPPVNSTDASTSTPTSSEVPPFRTTRNVFGLIRQFFSSTPPIPQPRRSPHAPRYQLCSSYYIGRARYSRQAPRHFISPLPQLIIFRARPLVLAWWRPEVSSEFQGTH
jgi:hypothetical protein